MHSSLTRLQNVFGFFTTCAFVVAGLAALSVFLHPAHPAADITLRNVQVVKGRPHYYSSKKEEYAHIKFDLSADLSSLFNWNTKQLFVYVVATYPSVNKAGEVLGQNEAIIWDTIIPAAETTWSLSNIKDRYFGGKSKSKSKKPSTRRSAPVKKGDTKESTKPGILNIKNQKPKYQITDPSGILSLKQNATLTVGWNVQPWVGALIWDKGLLGGVAGSWTPGKDGVSAPWDFPALKGSRADAAKAENERKEGKKLEEGKATGAVPT